MRLSAVAASDRRTEVYRITDSGRLEYRWLDTSTADQDWSEWSRVSFEYEALGVAAISGWPEQIEIFVIDKSGHVWNRWWWHDQSWTPRDGFNPLGRPFAARKVRGFSALSAGEGHFNVFVEAQDGRIAVLPHVPGHEGPSWLRCDSADSLGDGWWPAFGLASTGVYRLPRQDDPPLA